MGNTVSNIGKAIGKGVVDVGHTLGKGLEVAAPILGSIPGVGTIGGGALGALGGLIAPGGNIGTALGGAAKGAAGSVLGSVLGGSGVLSGLGGLAKDIPGLGSLGSSLGNIPGLSQLGGVGSDISSLLGHIPGLGTLGSAAGSVGSALGAGASDLGGLLGGAGSDLGKLLGIGGGSSTSSTGSSSSNLPLILSALGIGASGLINGSNPLNPTALNDPRQTSTNTFSDMLTNALKNGGDIGTVLAQLGQGPAYGGQLTAGLNAGQQGALNSINGQLSGYDPNQANSILSQLGLMGQSGNSLNIPPQLAALLGQGQNNNSNMANVSALAGGGTTLQQQIQALAGGNPNASITSALTGMGSGSAPGMDALSQLLGGYNNPAAAALLGVNTNTPEQTMLQALATSSANPYISALGSSGQGMNLGTMDIQQLLRNPNAQALLAGGRGNDLNSIGAAIAAAAQPAQDAGLRDLREQFSFNGLRKSTDLNAAASQYLSNNQASLQGQLAQIAPALSAQANQTSLGALQALLGGAGQAGQLGLGQSQLGQSGLQGAASATTSQLGTLGNILSSAGQLGQGSIASQIQALSSGANVDVNQLQALLGGASSLGQLGVSGQGNVLQALLGAGNLNQQGQNSSLDALNTLLGTQANAAGQQAITGQQGATAANQNATQQASILQSLFSGQQNNALSALLAQPGALSQLTQLPASLAGQAFGLNTTAQQTQQQDLTTAYNAWLQQQSLTPQLLQYLGGAGPQQYAPSAANTIGSLLLTGSAAKQSK